MTVHAFPFKRLRFADENELYKQIVHIQSEMEEVIEAYHKDTDITRVAEELADLAQSAITGLWIIYRTHNVHPLDVVTRNNAKNSARGYDPCL